MRHGIYLDDTRPNPGGMCNHHARNFTEFREIVKSIHDAGELIDYVDFDYSLEDFPDPNWPYPYTKNGADCAEFLFSYHENHPVLDPDVVLDVHSSSTDYNKKIYAKIDLMKEVTGFGKEGLTTS